MITPRNNNQGCPGFIAYDAKISNPPVSKTLPRDKSSEANANISTRKTNIIHHLNVAYTLLLYTGVLKREGK
jgi:hypothetical protein